MRQVRPLCVGGRDAAQPSGRTGADLDPCLAQIDAVDCKHVRELASYERCALQSQAPP
jgi:hypothetical protein